MQVKQIVKTISKYEMREQLGYNSRRLFLKDIKVLTSDSDCPFTYLGFTTCGKYVRGRWAKYVFENL